MKNKSIQFGLLIQTLVCFSSLLFFLPQSAAADPDPAAQPHGRGAMKASEQTGSYLDPNSPEGKQFADELAKGLAGLIDHWSDAFGKQNGMPPATRDEWNFLPDFKPGESVYENMPEQEAAETAKEPFTWENTGPVPAEPVPDEGMNHGAKPASDNKGLPVVELDDVDQSQYIKDPAGPSQEGASPIDTFDVNTEADTSMKLDDIDFENLLRPDKVVFDAPRGVVVYYLDGKAHTEYEYKREALNRSRKAADADYSREYVDTGYMENNLKKLEGELAEAEKRGYTSITDSGGKGIRELKEKVEKTRQRINEKWQQVHQYAKDRNVWDKLLMELDLKLNNGQSYGSEYRSWKIRDNAGASEIPEHSAAAFEDNFAAADAINDSFAGVPMDATSIQHTSSGDAMPTPAPAGPECEHS